MRLAAWFVLALLAGCTAPHATSPSEGAAPLPVRFAKVADGFSSPILFLVDSHGSSFVVEQSGRVWEGIGADRRLAADVTNLTLSGGERGLLGMAFVPGSRDIILSYTDRAGDTALQRATLRDDGPAALGEVFFRLHQPYANHNGGDVVIGPDGWLWLGLGDGGGAGDPQQNGQDPKTLLGSLLRFDIANGSAQPQIWAKGLRNPWRFSFDRANGDLWIGDVGQNRYEEIDFVPAGASPPLDFGWNAREGKHAYPGGAPPFMALTEPVAEYDHADGSCSVTGGFVYRGSAMPEMRGAYVFADYCSGHVWSLTRVAGAWRMARLFDSGFAISSFGEDAAGEIVACAHDQGALYRLEAA